MDMLTKYLPVVLQDVVEYKAINLALGFELSLQTEEIDAVPREVVIATATDYGLSRYEELFGIINTAGDDEELRRFKIQSILSNKLPYTKRWLERRLTEIAGLNAWTYNINYDEYELDIRISGVRFEIMQEVERQFRQRIPANMELQIGSIDPQQETIYVGQATQLGIKFLAISGY